jgi:hypothetical protein
MLKYQILIKSFLLNCVFICCVKTPQDSVYPEDDPRVSKNVVLIKTKT